ILIDGFLGGDGEGSLAVEGGALVEEVFCGVEGEVVFTEEVGALPVGEGLAADVGESAAFEGGCLVLAMVGAEGEVTAAVEKGVGCVGEGSGVDLGLAGGGEGGGLVGEVLGEAEV
ncbi:hypothetical protein ALO_11724, partial [Acetonema longum DSM 6540]